MIKKINIFLTLSILFLVSNIQVAKADADLIPVYTNSVDQQTRFGALITDKLETKTFATPSLLKYLANQKLLVAGFSTTQTKIKLGVQWAMGAKWYCTSDSSRCFTTKQIIDLIKTLKGLAASGQQPTCITTSAPGYSITINSL